MGGKDLELEPLKLLQEEQDFEVEARVAMVQVGLHMDTMECYSCHSTWAPQCYGCHVKIDYSNGARCFDWVAAGHLHDLAAHTADAGESDYDTFIPGEIKEQRSYLRWEDPGLGVNGEHRVTPVAPGCQVSATIIGPNGETIVKNHIFRTAPGAEGGGTGRAARDRTWPPPNHTPTGVPAIASRATYHLKRWDTASTAGASIAPGMSPPWSIS